MARLQTYHKNSYIQHKSFSHLYVVQRQLLTLYGTCVIYTFLYILIYTGFHQPDIRQRNVDISLNELRPATVDEVSAIIKKSSAKQCSLDPMPTWLLKECSGVMVPIITAMCNASITQSKFPAAHKSAIVRPLLRNLSLDTADLNSY